MTQRRQRDRRFGLLLAIALFTASCGGKTQEQEDPGSDGGGSEPVPECSTICDHVVGACAPGANTDACTLDCAATVAQYKGCTQLAPYLKCMSSTPVECGDAMVTILGCSEERTALEQCMPNRGPI